MAIWLQIKQSEFQCHDFNEKRTYRYKFWVPALMDNNKTRNFHVKNPFITLKKNTKSNFVLLIHTILWMNFMNSSLYFNFKDYIFDSFVDYSNCQPDMLIFEVDARRKFVNM